ncbi:MAG: 50S ribosomal protein L7/L12 [Candidatus Omnitrophota bacterium]
MSEQVKEEKQEAVKLSPKSEEIIKSIEEMSVLELANLVKVLEEKFGVSAAMPMAIAAAPGAAAAAVAEEKTSFNVILASVGDKKIQVIKEIRAITSLGLKEAKDLVDSAPKPVKENVSKEEAEEIKKKLEEQGAKIELK